MRILAQIALAATLTIVHIVSSTDSKEKHAVQIVVKSPATLMQLLHASRLSITNVAPNLNFSLRGEIQYTKNDFL